ncbi:hypothetical protein BGZ51_008266 [Haplosporangium sp. Z 767]|nr:hypothetical protein BGZ51_008266 [Haplosporangium sp. Z 767]
MDAVHEFKTLVLVTFLVDKAFLFMPKVLPEMADEDRAIMMDLGREWTAAQEDMARFVQNADEYFILAIEDKLEQDDFIYINNKNNDREQGFQFWMLQKCPSLEVISKDISMPSDMHKRRIALSDLMLPDLDQVSNIEDSSRYISLPKLRVLNMFGPWHFEENVLFEPFSKVALNIDELNEYGCTGFDLEEWMHDMDELRLLGKASSSLDVTEEQLLAFGLKNQTMVRSRLALNTLNLEWLNLNSRNTFDADDTDAKSAQESRPISLEPSLWSWDWYLPKLKNLELCSKFGRDFQLRMLSKCPKLVSLRLFNNVSLSYLSVTLADPMDA